MEYRKLHLVGFGLALSGCLALGVNFVLSESVLLSEVAPTGVIVLANTLVLVVGLRNLLLKTETEYDLDHSMAYRVANVGAVIITIAAGLLLFAVGIVSLGVFG